MAECQTPDDPKCDRCGAPITTGLMAAICPRREQCEFWPDDAESQQFLDSLGMRLHPNAKGEKT
jgi:hypothetical protein